jgi:hypothetical protein
MTGLPIAYLPLHHEAVTVTDTRTDGYDELCSNRYR